MTPPPTAAAHAGVLDSGPQPLTRRDARWWAAAVVAVGVVFALVLPVLAAWVASRAVPPGAVTFGAASVIPAPGWTVEDTGADRVVLTKGGVVATFDSQQYAGGGPARLASLQQEVVAQNPTLTTASEPRPFRVPTGQDGLLRALAGVGETAVIGTVVARGVAADMVAVGDSKSVTGTAADLERMLASIRIHADGDGGGP